mmetsp:Transcript_83490/g.260743  ORF Transcript_83490/g.260743 Transcript_83490/m.260743 type:complete len:485 (+) Transcript_83490:2-1456(+)
MHGGGRHAQAGGGTPSPTRRASLAAKSLLQLGSKLLVCLDHLVERGHAELAGGARHAEALRDEGADLQHLLGPHVVQQLPGLRCEAEAALQSNDWLAPVTGVVLHRVLKAEGRGDVGAPFRHLKLLQARGLPHLVVVDIDLRVQTLTVRPEDTSGLAATPLEGAGPHPTATAQRGAQVEKGSGAVLVGGHPVVLTAPADLRLHNAEESLAPHGRDDGVQHLVVRGPAVSLDPALAELVAHPQLLGLMQANKRLCDGGPDGLVHHPERDDKGHDARWCTQQKTAFSQPRHEELPFCENLGHGVPILLQHGLLLVLVKPPIRPVGFPHARVQICKGPVRVLADVRGHAWREGFQENHGCPQGAEPAPEPHRAAGVVVSEDRGGGRRLLAQALLQQAPHPVPRSKRVVALVGGECDVEVRPNLLLRILCDLPVLLVSLLLSDGHPHGGPPVSMAGLLSARRRGLLVLLARLPLRGVRLLGKMVKVKE